MMMIINTIIFHSDTTTEITSLDQIQGDWWILKGQNCGQNELWNGGYDAYPCQLESYVQLESTGDWVNNNNNNNIFAIVQSTVSGLLKDSNTTVGVKNLLRWGSNRRPLVYKAGVFTIPPRI